MRRFVFLSTVSVVLFFGYLNFPFLKSFFKPVVIAEDTSLDILKSEGLPLAEQLSNVGLNLGSAAHIRIFKEERVLEVWMQQSDTFKLFKSYPICNFSGDLGPKLKEGDRQSPEGFYEVSKASLNPNSRFHLSFNLGFPNRFDRNHERTGSYLMVHGDCVSIGCYAMTDEGIEEIYSIVESALDSGQNSISVHAFPFRMTAERLSREKQNKWYGFWGNLKAGYDMFEETLKTPKVSVSGYSYVFEET